MKKLIWIVFPLLLLCLPRLAAGNEPGNPCPGGYGALDAHAGISFEAAYQSALAKVQAKDPRVTSIALRPGTEGNPPTLELWAERTGGAPQRVGYLEYQIKAGVLEDTYVRVEPPFRDLGLNRLALLSLLKDHPEVTQSKTVLSAVNLGAFVSRLVVTADPNQIKGRDGFAEKHSEMPSVSTYLNDRLVKAMRTLKDPVAIIATRKALIVAFQSTPEGRVHASAGFNKIDRILLSIDQEGQLGAYFEVARGDGDNEANTKISWYDAKTDPNRLVQLTAKGERKPISRRPLPPE